MKFWMLLLLGLLSLGAVGCEIEGDVDDDNGKLEVDVDD